MTGRYKGPRSKILRSLGLCLQFKDSGTASLIIHVALILSIEEIHSLTYKDTYCLSRVIINKIYKYFTYL